MLCSHCGHTLEDSNHYCPHCGTSNTSSRQTSSVNSPFTIATSLYPKDPLPPITNTSPPKRKSQFWVIPLIIISPILAIFLGLFIIFFCTPLPDILLNHYTTANKPETSSSIQAPTPTATTNLLENSLPFLIGTTELYPYVFEYTPSDLAATLPTEFFNSGRESYDNFHSFEELIVIEGTNGSCTGIYWAIPTTGELLHNYSYKGVTLGSTPEEIIKSLNLPYLTTQASQYYIMHFKFRYNDSVWKLSCRIKDDGLYASGISLDYVSPVQANGTGLTYATIDPSNLTQTAQPLTESDLAMLPYYMTYNLNHSYDETIITYKVFDNYLVATNHSGTRISSPFLIYNYNGEMYKLSSEEKVIDHDGEFVFNLVNLSSSDIDALINADTTSLHFSQ